MCIALLILNGGKNTYENCSLKKEQNGGKFIVYSFGYLKFDITKRKKIIKRLLGKNGGQTFCNEMVIDRVNKIGIVCGRSKFGTIYVKHTYLYPKM